MHRILFPEEDVYIEESRADLGSVSTGMHQLVGKCQRKHLISALWTMCPRIEYLQCLRQAQVRVWHKSIRFIVIMMDNLRKMTFSRCIRKPCNSEASPFQISSFHWCNKLTKLVKVGGISLLATKKTEKSIKGRTVLKCSERKPWCF